MNNISPHRWWLAAFVAALLFLACGNPLLRVANRELEQRTGKLEKEKQELSQSIAQLRSDAAEAERLSRDMKAEDASVYLAPVNRRGIAAQFEPLAAASRLSRFTYTLSPEQPFETADASPDMNGLAQSTLTLEADTPHDGDVYRFLVRIMNSLPGRVRLSQLNIERLNAAANAPLAAANVRMTASIGWLANASRKGDE